MSTEPKHISDIINGMDIAPESSVSQNWIHIPSNTPSLKNGKEIIQLPIRGARPCPACRKRPSRPMLTASKRHKAYKNETAIIWKANAHKFRGLAQGLDKPIHVALYFVRDSRRKFDFTNAADTVQDLMTEFSWIDDDNTSEMIPVYAGHHVSKANAGVYISVIEQPQKLDISGIPQD